MNTLRTATRFVLLILAIIFIYCEGLDAQDQSDQLELSMPFHQDVNDAMMYLDLTVRDLVEATGDIRILDVIYYHQSVFLDRLTVEKLAIKLQCKIVKNRGVLELYPLYL